MNILDYFRPEKKESAVSRVVVQNIGQPAWTKGDFKAMAREGYQQNVVAYQAINRIADAVAGIKWRVWRGENELDQHPLYDLLKRPNPMQSGTEFIRSKISFLMLGGNSYDERIVVGNEIKELYSLRPDRMKIIPGSAWPFPMAYEYRVGGRKHRWDVDQKTGKSDILHMKLFNPQDDWYGQSPIEAGAKGVDQHNEAMSWMQALLQNSARPSGALVFGDGAPMSDEAFARLKAQIEEQYSGAQNAGRPMLLEGGLDWKEMGLSPSDMSLIETKSSAARDICLAFGVPPQLLGIPGDNTYSNYQEARLAFWEDTVLPLVSYVAAEWSAWFGQVYGEAISVHPDLDAIPAIADKRLSLWSMADNSKDLTINERRNLKGYPEIEGGEAIPATFNPQEIAELHKLAQSVADGILPADSAAAIAGAAFPALTDEQITAIIKPAENFTPQIDMTGGAGV